MTHRAMVVDLTGCSGCDTCVIACKDEYVENEYPPYSAAQPELGQFWMQVEEVRRGRFPFPKYGYLPTPCMQCDDPPCMAAYPSAISKRGNGIVIIDPTVTTDEGIVDSCPYGAIYWNEDLQIGQKCTFCAHRLEEGLMPKCVESCHSRIMFFGDLDDPSSEVSNLIVEKKAKPLLPELGTMPNVYYVDLPSKTVAGKVVDYTENVSFDGVTVTLTDLRTGELAAVQTDQYGNFEFKELANRKLYLVRLEAPGYYPRIRLAYVADYTHLGMISMFKRA